MQTLLTPLQPYHGQPLVLGVSGGADSVGLFRALLEIGAKPVVGHLDHALREDSANDAEWVRQLCAEHNIPYESSRVNVAKIAQQRNWNLEEAARRIRYDFLSRVAKQHDCQTILTAHTLRDQAETVLIQLLRGEAQLVGIPTVRGAIHRPWLDVPRANIEDYLQGLEQTWREDPTNADTHYTRAWIRQAIMPLLTERYPATERTLARVARYAQQDHQALQTWASRIREHVELTNLPEAVLRRFIANQLTEAGLNFHSQHLEELVTSIQQKKTTHLTLPKQQSVTLTGGKLHTQPMTFHPPPFAYDPAWTVRTWQPGDRIKLSGGTRKISDILTEAHIPASDRPQVPLLEDKTGQIRWLGLEPHQNNIWAWSAHQNPPENPAYWGMRLALEQAELALKQQEVPVGAILLDSQNNVVGQGYNTSHQDGNMTKHAEMAAIHSACQHLNTPYLKGCTLIVTLEPCPMCLGAALEARIDHIIYGASNPKSGALGGVSDLLADHWGHRPNIKGGILAGRAAKLLKQGFAALRAKSP